MSEWVHTLPFTHNPQRSDDHCYPPEFKFDPDTGAELVLCSPAVNQQSWLPPYGHGLSLQPHSAYGLRQTPLRIELKNAQQRNELAEPDHTLELPAAGDFEFFSLPCGTLAPMLLALEPRKGQIFVWLEKARQWQELHDEQGSLIAPVHDANKKAWRAEAASSSAQHSMLFVPTEEGIACIAPNAASLSYSVHYIGQGAALAAPGKWTDSIWAPVEKDGQLNVVRTDLQGRSEEWLSLDTETLPPLSGLNSFQAPISSARNLVWMCNAGRLQITRKSASNEVLVSFLPWPDGLVPQFDFGSPYQAKDGDLWQLCQNTTDRTYEYLNLSARQTMREIAEQPRPCTGQFNYRLAQRVHTAPWTEPGHGHDGAQTSVVLPQLESTNNNAVLGIRVEKSPQGMANMLRSKERQRAILICETGSQTAFGQVMVTAPWCLRWFMHNHKLWAFHPELRAIFGWELAS